MTGTDAGAMAARILATHLEVTRIDDERYSACFIDRVPYPCDARQLALLVLGRQLCAHCGQECGGREAGIGSVPDGKGGSVPVCHPDDPQRPDCYRRITVYAEPLGALISPFALPRGIEGIRRTDPVPEQ